MRKCEVEVRSRCKVGRPRRLSLAYSDARIGFIITKN